MTAGYIGNRHSGLGRFLDKRHLLLRGVAPAALNPSKHFDSISTVRHSRKTRRKPSSYSCDWCPVQIGAAPVAHVRRATSAYEATWSADEIRQDMEYLTADRYRPLKAPKESHIRCVMLGSLLEIERAIDEAIEGNAPNRLNWGSLTAQEFLTVVDDVTTWSLTHFEPVSAWSRAEDLTAVEEQEGYGIVGRCRRQGRPADRTPRGDRSLRDVMHPKVRGAALWVAHALLAESHDDASDRASGYTAKERQVARIFGSAPAGQQWLADRQERWPRAYRHQWWTEVRQLSATAAV